MGNYDEGTRPHVRSRNKKVDEAEGSVAGSVLFSFRFFELGRAEWAEAQRKRVAYSKREIESKNYQNVFPKPYPNRQNLELSECRERATSPISSPALLCPQY